MSRVLRILLAGGCLLVAAPALAQFIPPPPELENRIPAPLPPPPQPPIINGPLSRSPPPGVAGQRPLTTHSDRTTRCLHLGAGYGLRGADLDAYARACGNAN